MSNQSELLEIHLTRCWLLTAAYGAVRLKQSRQTRCNPAISMLLIIDAIPRRAALIGPSFCKLSPRSDVELWRHKYWEVGLSVAPSLHVWEITCRLRFQSIVMGQPRSNLDFGTVVKPLGITVKKEAGKVVETSDVVRFQATRGFWKSGQELRSPK